MSDVTVCLVVAAGKKEQSRRFVHVTDGAVVAAGEGSPPSEPDVVLTLTPADAQAVHEGRLDLSVGFMRGQVKMAGDFGALLRFLPLTAGSDPPVPAPSLLP